jgi:hypothetical protein
MIIFCCGLGQVKDNHPPPTWSGRVSAGLSSAPTQCCEGLFRRKSTRSDHGGCVPQENDLEGWGAAAAIEAVLKAADNWVTAQAAMVTAKKEGGDPEVEREAADCAGVLLVRAVMAWRPPFS